MLLSAFDIKEFLIEFSLKIDGIIYNFIKYFFDIFMAIAKINIFSNDSYNEIVSRVYVVLGVLMLFVLAYGLLNAVIDPDKFSKGDYAPSKIIKNVLFSLILVILFPYIFSSAFKIQNIILDNNILGKIVDKDVTAEDNVKNNGTIFASEVFYTFFHPNPSWCMNESLDACAEQISTDQGGVGDNLAEEYEAVLNYDASFENFTAYSEKVLKPSNSPESNQITYYFVLSTLTGLGLLILIASFCADLGVRVVKLAFYQIIAPVPIIFKILPNQKKMFDSWLKKTISTFLEVFSRIFIMYIGIFVIKILSDNREDFMNDFTLMNLGISQKLIAYALLIIGTIIFVKQAPSIFKDIFGFEGKGLFANAKEALNIGRKSVGNVAVSTGAMGLGAVRNWHNKWSDGRKWSELSNKERAKKVFSTGGSALTSSIAGGVSSFTRTFSKGTKAKSFKDLTKAGSEGIAGAKNARDVRAHYKATHGGTISGAIEGHVHDFGDWIVGAGVEKWDFIIKQADEINSNFKKFKSAAESIVEKNLHDIGLLDRNNANFRINLDDCQRDQNLLNIYRNEYEGKSLYYADSRLKQIQDQIGNTDYKKLANLEKEIYKDITATPIFPETQKTRADFNSNIEYENYKQMYDHRKSVYENQWKTRLSELEQKFGVNGIAAVNARLSQERAAVDTKYEQQQKADLEMLDKTKMVNEIMHKKAENNVMEAMRIADSNAPNYNGNAMLIGSIKADKLIEGHELCSQTINSMNLAGENLTGATVKNIDDKNKEFQQKRHKASTERQKYLDKNKAKK